MPLSKLIEDTIPLNRKERYYTGTVLPMIVCKKNFKYFDRFLRTLPGPEVPTPASGWTLENILFFTEYSINESLIMREHRDRFAALPKDKDTSDVLIFISEPEPVLIAIEAKMYDSPDSTDLEAQVQRQKKQLLPMRQALSDSLGREVRFLQCALVPERLYNKIRNEYDLGVILWEQVYQAYSDFADDYFMQVLSYAIEKYNDLASLGRSA